MTRRKQIPKSTQFEELLVPVFRDGECVYDAPSINEIRDRAARQLALLDPSIRRFTNPHQYPVGLEKRLFDLRTAQILRVRAVNHE